ncbi:MAG TPA: type II toxin-antitoxin system death-on-curing family toxin [Candidatus Saccharibacteria bacterium]|nr:type II toxin-antitoxin system death-on-curing family toxin [Candidatus Saccharibacteria bacterium]HMT56013.1 type II toxin-antitoxin system death-on-curing family toxin [Candidatus Saccharibacteria bacterium]
MKKLTLKDLELIHMQIIDVSGGSQGVRDINRLESALASQFQEVFGEDLYPTVYEKAAVLARGVIADHPFVDGNKRTGLMAALVFLNLNDIDTTELTDKELEDFAVQIAVEHLDVPVISAWLKAHGKKR